MYIRLGKSNLINDPNKENSEFFIVSQVVDSQLGYEKPIIVKTKEQLDTWFGKDYSDYNYLSSLVDQGISLYISKPITSVNSGYAEESTTFYSEEIVDPVNTFQNGVTIKNLPKIGEENIIYKVIDPQGTESFRLSSGEIINYTKKTYSKEFSMYTVPQDTRISDKNRDTLVVFKSDCPIKYCTPSYNPNIITPKNYYIYREGTWVYSSTPNGVKFKGNTLEDLKGINNLYTSGNKIELVNQILLNINQDDVNSINDERKTLVFNIDFSEFKDGSYISMKSLYNKMLPYLIYNSETTKRPDEIFKSTKINKYFKDGEGFRTIKVTSVSELKSIIESLGYYIEGDSIYSFQAVPVTYFTNLSRFLPDFQKSHDLIYQCFKDKVALKLYSRTIGSGGVEGNIEVTIEKSSVEDSVLVTTNRFGYSRSIESERGLIDHTINTESPLIYCELIDTDFHLLETGVEMKGTVEEQLTKSMYNDTTDYLFHNSNVYPDYFLIPDTTRYIDNKDLGETFYRTILDYSKYLNCQVLISNTWDNYKKNYLEDFDNRLIYFLGNITTNSNTYPGYYLYLKGLFTDIYSVSANDVLYKTPTNIFKEDIYDEKFKVEFEKYKSNYLTCNDNMFFYKTYLNGEKYNTTGWMRFAISKITREIEKNKWKLIGERDNSGIIQRNFNYLINTIVTSFRIINSIDIIQFNLDLAKNKLDIKLQTSVNDLVKNDITLELTVNYSNKT